MPPSCTAHAHRAPHLPAALAPADDDIRETPRCCLTGCRARVEVPRRCRPADQAAGVHRPGSLLGTRTNTTGVRVPTFASHGMTGARAPRVPTPAARAGAFAPQRPDLPR